MRWVRVLEHGRIPVVDDEDRVSETTVTRSEYRRLGRADRWKGTEGGSVFRWHAHSLSARHWVGVLQVPGLSVEVLPKIQDTTGDPSKEAFDFARRNLLTMLAVAGELPLRERDTADLSLQKQPISKTLLALFATRLEEALRVGMDHGYVVEEDDLPILRGRLLPARQAAKLPGRLDRFAVRFEHFCGDTALNRVLKAACRQGLRAGPAAATAQGLGRCLAAYDEVADLPVERLGIDVIQITRQNERFRTLFNFARLILSQQSPTASSGPTRTFSLLFDMNVLFERYITAILERFVLPSFPSLALHAQARRSQRFLLDGPGGKGVLALKPDLLLLQDRSPRLLLDTKWKRMDMALKGDRGPSREDLYQLFAYACRYQCARNVLLYPRTENSHDLDYGVPAGSGAPEGSRIGLRYVNLSRDLRKERGELVAELRDLVARELGIAPLEVAA